MTGISDNAITAQTLHAVNAAGQLPNMNHNGNMREMRKVAKDFEAVFIAQMLQPMFQNIKPEGPFGGGHAEEVWRGMQVQEYGKAITEAGGIGIADTVLREMIKMQELK
jgi:peptidoglycan hydrolase FlgJ